MNSDIIQSTRRLTSIELKWFLYNDDNDDDRESGARVSERVPTRRSNPPSAIITQIVPHRPTKGIFLELWRLLCNNVGSFFERDDILIWCRLGYMCGWYSRPFAFEDIWWFTVRERLTSKFGRNLKYISPVLADPPPPHSTQVLMDHLFPLVPALSAAA